MTNAKTQTQAEQTSAETYGMLRSLKDLEDYRIAATDGHIGKIYDFFFDDQFWIVRYVVADTGNWLPGRKVLLTPGVLINANWRDRSFSVAMDRKHVESSPDVDTDKPVSRQREIELHSYYGWPFYWTAGGVWPGMVAAPASVPQAPRESGDPHLRSVREVIGYNIEATDGTIGGVDDFIADDESWVIRYLVISTHKWLPGRKVLIAPQWCAGPVRWSEHKIMVNLTRDQIKSSPEFDPSTPVNREYEEKLYDFYGRPRYWS